MNKVIQLLESTKQKQKEAMKQLPKMVDEHVATVAVEGELFINEIDQALLVLSNVVGQSEQLPCSYCKPMEYDIDGIRFFKCRTCGKPMK